MYFNESFFNNNQQPQNRTAPTKAYQPSFDLRNNLARILAKHALKVAGQEVTIDFYICNEVPNTFYGNPVLLEELLDGLLQYSIQATPQGTVSVRVSAACVHLNNCNDVRLLLSFCLGWNSNNDSTMSVQTGSQNCPPNKNRRHGTDIVDLPRIKSLCQQLDGSFETRYIDPCMVHEAEVVLRQAPHISRHQPA